MDHSVDLYVLTLLCLDAHIHGLLPVTHGQFDRVPRLKRPGTEKIKRAHDVMDTAGDIDLLLAHDRVLDEIAFEIRCLFSLGIEGDVGIPAALTLYGIHRAVLDAECTLIVRCKLVVHLVELRHQTRGIELQKRLPSASRSL